MHETKVAFLLRLNLGNSYSNSNPTHLAIHSHSLQRAAALMVPPPPPAKAAPAGVIASPLFYLARFAMALAPSSLVMAGAGVLTPALLEPVQAVHAQGDTEFKVKKKEAWLGRVGLVYGNWVVVG